MNLYHFWRAQSPAEVGSARRLGDGLTSDGRDEKSPGPRDNFATYIHQWFVEEHNTSTIHHNTYKKS
jgi:hypothetical protein